jgi:hypothetical protein
MALTHLEENVRNSGYFFFLPKYNEDDIAKVDEI